MYGFLHTEAIIDV